jgi:hypothetical protein
MGCLVVALAGVDLLDELALAEGTAVGAEL